MITISIHISTIILNIYGISSPVKGWLNGPKPKIHQSIVYKKHTLTLKTSTTLQEKDGRKYSHQMGPGVKEASLS